MSSRDDLPYYRLGRRSVGTGARPPTPDEQANADAYAVKLEQMLELSGGSVIELATFMWELAGELQLQRWSHRGGAIRAVRQCLDGHPMLGWGYDIVDATIAFMKEEA